MAMASYLASSQFLARRSVITFSAPGMMAWRSVMHC